LVAALREFRTMFSWHCQLVCAWWLINIHVYHVCVCVCLSLSLALLSGTSLGAV
jgi:hypothetical protein